MDEINAAPKRGTKEEAFWTRFRKRLIRQRRASGVSQRQLAKLANYNSKQSISNIEHGRQRPDLYRACMMATALEIDLDHLVAAKPIERQTT